jgi:hypothetical protein
VQFLKGHKRVKKRSIHPNLSYGKSNNKTRNKQKQKTKKNLMIEKNKEPKQDEKATTSTTDGP